MITLLTSQGAYLLNGRTRLAAASDPDILRQRLETCGEAGIALHELNQESARKQTITYRVLQAHNRSPDPMRLQLQADALASHDITYVGIIQTARVSGLEAFPLPYVLTNCHNSLCAVGGTINADDHLFGLSAARKYGGIFVPAHQAVIHQYMREMFAGCGKIILASDSHTRYGALGTMGFGEGGPELVKQLVGRTYDLPYPEVVAVFLEGSPQPGVGPHDVALALIKAVFVNGFVKNKILEFVGPGIANLSVDFRNGIDVMTTETTCLSSIWATDEQVQNYLAQHGRPHDYKPLQPGAVSYYDALITINLSEIEPMIAFPFHPSNVFPIREVNAHTDDILRHVETEGQKLLDQPGLAFNLHSKLEQGRLRVDQGIVAGCAGGTFENIAAVSALLNGQTLGNGSFELNVYPASQPILLNMLRQDLAAVLLKAGATIRTAFCGPCFGAGDVPANQMLSIRHTTRNFPNREGSKPSDGQLASVALMDARSIAATALHQGLLTPATEVNLPKTSVTYSFDCSAYDQRVYQGVGQPQPDLPLHFGPNIADWPSLPPLPEHLLLQVCAVIHDPVTTTDELIPSGETSSYRSNPIKLASFTLSRKDPGYVPRAKAIQNIEQQRQAWGSQAAETTLPQAVEAIFQPLVQHSLIASDALPIIVQTTGIGSVLTAIKPGDGSAREQAASCQKVLGGWANIACEYATKRYRSNLINWGLLPFTTDETTLTILALTDLIFLPNLRQALQSGQAEIEAHLIRPTGTKPLRLILSGLTSAEREILLAGCLMNTYRKPTGKLCR